jgi:lysophospholipase L1-like esterase
MALDRRTFVALCATAAFGGLSACAKSSAANDRIDRPGGGDQGDPAAPPREIKSVVVLGDSISRATTDEYATAFSANGIPEVRVEAEVGRRIEVGNGKGSSPLSGVRTLFGLLSESVSPDAWVIELGTNDIGSYPTADAYGELIDQILGMLPVEVPLVWVNCYRPQYLDHTNMFNMVLQQRINDRPNAVVTDWFSTASAKDQDVLRSDDLHPNDFGSSVLALLVAQSLLTF